MERQEYIGIQELAFENEPSWTLETLLETVNQQLIGLAQQDQFKKGFTTENRTVTGKD